MSHKKNDVAAALLSVLALVGAVPIVLATFLQLKPGASVTLERYGAFLSEPHLAIVYAILFGVGCLLAVRADKIIWGVILLPLLAIAIWPIFRAADEELPVPTGAIVAFAGDCPLGWQASTDLAGRFMLGAGKDTDEIYWKQGESGGAWDINLSKENLPSHEHSYYDIWYSEAASRRREGGVGGQPTVEVPKGFGSGDSDSDNNRGLYLRRNTSSYGPGQTYIHKQPYFTVTFCVRNRPTASVTINRTQNKPSSDVAAE